MAVKKRGLGRGLDALLSSAPVTPPKEPSTSLASNQLPVGDLLPNRFQPRSHFEESGLEELAQSIREQGVVQPIVVSEQPDTPGQYTIVAGERRWRAAQRAGLESVPVVLREVSGDQELLELALVENVQRRDLNPVEEAEAYRLLQERFSLSQEQIARRVGKARATVTNGLRLLRLSREVQDLLRSGQLTAGQARPLLALADEEKQAELAQRAVEEGLTARALEALTAVRRNETPAPPQGSSKQEPAAIEVHTAAAAEKLTRHLQTQVHIKRRGKSGVVNIRFHSEEELIRIYDLLMARGDNE
ncbi:MAG: ParB/RepB/Spo0J family partition protein [Deltaproteobacteria bacterium]|nr:ParB/RepB/Spo0J family partition protein [Deltaproteobacteria bacterium]